MKPILVKPKTAPLSVPGANREPPGPPPASGAERSWAHLAATLRFDGLFWRRLARLGSVYGPEWWKRYSPPFFAAAIFAVAHRNRRGAAACQARILGVDASSPRAYLAAFRMFRTFAHCMTETMEFYGPSPRPFRIAEPPRNGVAEALGRGHGVILATAHVGNWDISARALQATGRPVNIVMAREPNETTQEYARRTREQVGVTVILSDSSVFSAFNMIRALRRNEILAIQLDRPATGPTSPAGIRAVPFLGDEAPFLEGPFHLARLSGAPVIPVFTLRRGVRHYEIVLGEPRYVSRDAAGDAGQALREAVALLERTVRANSDQWFQFAPLWANG
ncbi:MAG: lysophospholipid acyltransferase family protein [Candidatus Binatia bacterium]